jgi:hypothetical protein
MSEISIMRHRENYQITPEISCAQEMKSVNEARAGLCHSLRTTLQESAFRAFQY